MHLIVQRNIIGKLKRPVRASKNIAPQPFKSFLHTIARICYCFAGQILEQKKAPHEALD